MRKFVLLAVLGLAGCSERVPLVSSNPVSTAKAITSGTYRVNYRSVFISRGQEFPVLSLVDGRKAVILNEWTSTDIFFPIFSNMQQINGSILDDSGCTTSELALINSRDVIIEQSAKVVPAGICFDLF